MAEKKQKDKLGLDIPEKRSSLLYVRIKERNREFLEAEAKEREATLTEVVDAIFDRARESAG